MRNTRPIGRSRVKKAGVERRQTLQHDLTDSSPVFFPQDTSTRTESQQQGDLMTHLQKFLESLTHVLPEICADKDLFLHLPNIFKSLPTIHRMRGKKQVPSHFYVAPNFYYLRDDVISWLLDQYVVAPTAKKLGRPPKMLPRN